MVVELLKNNFMKKGFSTLYVVIILGSFALALSIALATSSLLTVRGSIDVKNGNQAKALVNACAEVVLEMMRENNTYTGSGSVTLEANTCNYTIVNTGGTTRLINLSGIVGGVVRKLEITTSAFNKMKISSWQEIQ